MKRNRFESVRSEHKKLVGVACLSFFIWSFCIAYSTPGFQSDNFIQQAAWWGSLYPRTSLKSAMRLVESRTAEEAARNETVKGSGLWPELGRILGEDIPVKIEWKCLDLFR